MNSTTNTILSNTTYGQFYHLFIVYDYANDKFRTYIDADTQGQLQEFTETLPSTNRDGIKRFSLGMILSRMTEILIWIVHLSSVPRALSLQEAQSWANYVDNSFSYATGVTDYTINKGLATVSVETGPLTTFIPGLIGLCGQWQ